MNLKEAFRYQKFLDSMMYQASNSITNRDHAMKIVRIHHMNAANPDVEDKTEEVVPDHPFFTNDEVLRLMEWLVDEKQKLSEALGVTVQNISNMCSEV